jgi:hypothetical protein
MKMKFSALIITCLLTFIAAQQAGATAISINNLGGDAVSAEITDTPPNPVNPDPNDNRLLVWDEVQNITLTSNLAVDRVADPGASFVTGSSGNYEILAGTVVSSHYVQWDPDGNGDVTADLVFDSDIFAFIVADSKLEDSDPILGLPGLDYNDFFNRALESGDLTTISGNTVSIDWGASSPGDWTRLITAFSPAAEVPVPGAVYLLGSGLLGLLGLRSRKRA